MSQITINILPVHSGVLVAVHPPYYVSTVAGPIPIPRFVKHYPTQNEALFDLPTFVQTVLDEHGRDCNSSAARQIIDPTAEMAWAAAVERARREANEG